MNKNCKCAACGADYDPTDKVRQEHIADAINNMSGSRISIDKLCPTCAQDLIDIIWRR